MKKIYLLGFAALACTVATAQTTLKVKMNKRGAQTEAAQKSGNTPGVNQLAGSIMCQTQYVAGTTMDLNFTITLTNTDFEYGDSVSITFPAGITPNTSLNNSDPIASDASDPGTDGPEALNGVVGQTITWGNNDNNWGGIVADAVAYPFTVNVTIAAGTTGNQLAAYFVSGDGFANPGDLSGNVTIFEAGAAIDDASAAMGGVQGTSYCNNTMLPIGVRIKNLGNTTISNFPVSYQVDATPVVTETITASIAPNDSLDYVFTTLADFSAEAEYMVNIFTGLSGDAITNNDTLASYWVNSIPVALTTTPYANDFEVAADFIALTTETVTGPTGWGLSATTFQSGAQALFYTVPAASASAGDAWVYFKCMDVVANDNYRITYWTRTNTGSNGSLGISYGTTQDAAGMTNTIKAATANTANSTWVKDSADFSPSTSGTIYIGFQGTGTSASATNVRLDNVNIFLVVPTGISEAAVSSVSVYPNPTTGIVNVNIVAKEAMVAVYNVLGEQVMNAKAFKGNNTIDLSSVSAGTYFVRVTENDKVVTQKITLTK